MNPAELCYPALVHDLDGYASRSLAGFVTLRAWKLSAIAAKVAQKARESSGDDTGINCPPRLTSRNSPEAKMAP